MILLLLFSFIVLPWNYFTSMLCGAILGFKVVPLLGAKVWWMVVLSF